MRPTLRILTQVPIPPSTASASAHASSLSAHGSAAAAFSPIARRAGTTASCVAAGDRAVPIKARSAGPLLASALWNEDVEMPIRAYSAPKTCCAAAIHPLSSLPTPHTERRDHSETAAAAAASYLAAPPLFQPSHSPAPSPIGFAQPPPPPPDARTTPLARRYIAFLRALSANLEAEGLAYNDADSAPAAVAPAAVPAAAIPSIQTLGPALDTASYRANPTTRASTVIHATLGRYFPDVVAHPRFRAAEHALDDNLPDPSIQRRVSFITEFLTTHVNADGTVRAPA